MCKYIYNRDAFKSTPGTITVLKRWRKEEMFPKQTTLY